jgi:ATPase subunit of ABC transporter with duplicated ATPase domains
LLDEPTNHLDLEARNWLEDYLTYYPHAFVLISHDRYFLDVTVDRIVELWNKRAYFYSGNYEKFLAQKAERKAQLEAASKTIGELSTLMCEGNGSFAGGATHSHCALGKNTPGTGSRLHSALFSPPGPTPHGKHSIAPTSQY